MKAHELANILESVREREAVRFGKQFGDDAEMSFRSGFYQCQLEVMGILIREEKNEYMDHSLPKVQN